MKATFPFLFITAALAAGGAYAESGADVLKAKGCLNCHEMDKKKVGPALKDIAAKHKGDKGAQSMLVAKLKDGKGHMKAAASEAELKAAVDYILSAK